MFWKNLLLFTYGEDMMSQNDEEPQLSNKEPNELVESDEPLFVGVDSSKETLLKEKCCYRKRCNS